MPNNRLSFQGLAELQAALRTMPEEIQGTGIEIVLAAAGKAALDIQAGYPIRQTNLQPGPRRRTPFFPPGSLHERVYIEPTQSNQYSFSIAVRATAPHVHLYEKGSAQRSTKRGFNRGRMPARPPSEWMVAKAIRYRAQMVADLTELVRSHGFEVHG